MKKILSLLVHNGFLFLALILSKTDAYAQNVNCNNLPPIIYTLTANSDGEIYIPSAASRGWKGGDTVRILAGSYSLIEIGDFKGDVCRPIVFINYGGQVSAENIRFGNDASYFKIVGTGTPNITYGFKVQPVAGIGVAIGLAHHVEVSNIEVINPNDLGFFFKINPSTSDPRTLYNDYRMTKFYIHHNYLHNIGGEGMYIGHSAPNGDGTTGQLVPIRMDSVEIAYNIVDGTDWDGIQLANGRYGCSIHHNKVSNYGRSNLGSQQGGILMGSNTNGDIYNNTVSNGTGNGIQVFGYGNINIYNNTMENCGSDFTTSGQESFFSNDYISTIETNPVQTLSLTNNIIKYPKSKGGIKIGSYNDNSGPANISNNQFCIPGAANNWQSSYISSNAPNTTISNNILLTDCATANQNPIANAGNDQAITLPVNVVTVNGSGNDPDGTISNYLWTKVSGPSNGSITSATQASTTITGMTNGIYKFELKVTDNLGSIGRDTVVITVNPAANVSPIANAGADQTITLPTNSVTLNGDGTDQDGTIASYLWTKLSGPVTGSITTATNASTTVTSLTAGTYKFELKVTDNLGSVGKDTVIITVNPAANVSPTANAGADQTITLPVNSVTLNGDGTDQDGTIASYLWTKLSGPVTGSITTATNASTTVTSLSSGTYKFELKVTDNLGSIGRDTVVITVNPAANVSPIANAGADQTITLPANSVTLNGDGTDQDGTIASYLWTKLSGPVTGSITTATNASTTVTSLSSGTYKFELKVTDNLGSIGRDTVVITVNPAANVSPIANAGADQTITLPANSVTLNGSGTDQDGTIASYFWREIQGPSNATILNPTNPSTSISNLGKGDYSFELMVTDNLGLISKDTMIVHTIVKSPQKNNLNIAPTVTNSTINLSFEFINANQIFQFQIYDTRGILKYSSGKQIAPYNVVSFLMNVSSFSTGYYVIAVNIGGKKNILGRFLKV